ncbi:unnamed protein product [Rotaria sp. Silwood1]|nr:unnamed protein product [Rotaria sp. Silwood1]
MMHNKLLGLPTYRASQVAMRAATADLDNDQTDDINPESTDTRKENPAKKLPYADQILIHYTHEKRFHSMKQDMHRIYDKVFKDTPVEHIKMIVGNRNRRATKHQLIRKRPKKHLLQNNNIQRTRKRKPKHQQNEAMNTAQNHHQPIKQHEPNAITNKKHS